MAIIAVQEILTVILNSIEKIILISIIIIATILLAKLSKYFLNKAFHKTRKNKLLKVDETTHAFLKHFLAGTIYVIGIGVALYTIPGFRTLSVSLFAGAGILAVIVGFASQAAFSNIVSGIFISIFKPFRVGDRIKLQTGLYGKVEDITLRHTVIKTYENIRHIIPNTKISEETIENVDLEDPKICRFIDYGISYNSNINKAMKIIREELVKHPNCIDNRTKEDKKNKEPIVWVKVIGWGDSSINLRAGVWSNDAMKSWKLKTDTLKSIKERFDKEGVEIPFPHRTVVMKK